MDEYNLLIDEDNLSDYIDEPDEEYDDIQFKELELLRILRKFIDRIGFDSSFIIFDSSDQKTLVKQCLKELQMDEKLFNDRAVLAEISNAKNDMQEPDSYSVKSRAKSLRFISIGFSILSLTSHSIIYLIPSAQTQVVSSLV